MALWQMPQGLELILRKLICFMNMFLLSGYRSTIILRKGMSGNLRRRAEYVFPCSIRFLLFKA